MPPVIILSVCTGSRHGTIVISLYPPIMVQLSQRGYSRHEDGRLLVIR